MKLYNSVTLKKKITKKKISRQTKNKTKYCERIF